MRKNKYLGLLGAASVLVSGKCPEKFINLASENGIKIWDIVQSSGNIKCKTDLSSLKKLEQFLQHTEFSLEVTAKSGVIPIAQFLVQRKFLLAGFFCFWLILFYLSGLVWQVDIEGLERVNKSTFVQYVETQGLHKWAKLKRLDLKAIEKQLPLQFPEIAWAAVERSGTRVLIRVVEKDYDPVQHGEVIDIVAEYDGIITEMMVLQGVSMAEAGMTVAEGDVLIAGYRENGKAVNAAGSIKAIVYFEGYGEAGLEEIKKEHTGQEETVRILQLGELSMPLTRKQPEFAHYDVAESVRYLRGKPGSPVRLVERRYREIKLTVLTYTPEQASALALKRAKLMAHQRVEEHADLLKTEVLDMTQETIFRFRVLLTAETRIGRERVQTRGENPFD